MADKRPPTDTDLFEGGAGFDADELRAEDEARPSIIPDTLALTVFRRKRKSMRLASSLSITKYKAERTAGYPTIFRPQVGAVGGDTEFQPKSNTLPLFITALATIIAANSAPMDRLVHALQSDRPLAAAASTVLPPEPTIVFEPLFGPQAVSACADECRRDSVDDVKACIRGCDRLSLSEYARRIRMVDNTPELDAERIALSCERKPTNTVPYENQADWEKDAKTVLSLLRGVSTSAPSGDFARGRLFYANLGIALRTLRLPPESKQSAKQTALAEKLLRASCLRAHITLNDLALVLVRQNGDELSHRYYTRLKQLLHPQTVQAEESALKDGKTLISTPAKPAA